MLYTQNQGLPDTHVVCTHWTYLESNRGIDDMLLQCIKMNESKIPARLMACMRPTLQTATLLLYPKISLQTPSQLH